MSKQFFSVFLEDRNVGAVTRSSSFAVSRICNEIDFSKDTYIVEYGPGDGVLTHACLSRMTPKSRLIAIETNHTFVRELRAIEDPRITVVKDSAHNVSAVLKENAVPHADYVLSGIPFSFLSPQMRRDIVRETKKMCRKGGKFIVYQYSPRMAKYMKQEFGNEKTSLIPFNFPIYFLMTSIKA